MSSNRALNAFLTSAAALGGLYLLDRLMAQGQDSRSNPKQYRHIKGYREFTELEKQSIADEYKHGLKSAKSLAKERGCNIKTIQIILKEKGVDLRDINDANRLASSIPVTQEQIDTILRMWNPPSGESRATVAKICETTGLTIRPVMRILKEYAGYEEKETTEISEDDKEKLLQGKRAEMLGGEKLILRRVNDQLGLSRLPGLIVLLRLFAENKLNNPSDYSGSLTPEQQHKILSYFDPEQTLTIGEIAENVGTTSNKVKVFLFYNNILPRDKVTFLEKPLREEEIAEIIRLYELGQTNMQIAERLSTYPKRIADVLNEYREAKGLRQSRRSESRFNINLGLITRHPLVIEKVMAERSKSPPVSFQKIADELNEEMPKKEGFEHFNISLHTVRRIYFDTLGK